MHSLFGSYSVCVVERVFFESVRASSSFSESSSSSSDSSLLRGDFKDNESVIDKCFNAIRISLI